MAIRVETTITWVNQLHSEAICCALVGAGLGWALPGAYGTAQRGAALFATTAVVASALTPPTSGFKTGRALIDIGVSTIPSLVVIGSGAWAKGIGRLSCIFIGTTRGFWSLVPSAENEMPERIPPILWVGLGYLHSIDTAVVMGTVAVNDLVCFHIYNRGQKAPDQPSLFREGGALVALAAVTHFTHLPWKPTAVAATLFYGQRYLRNPPCYQISIPDWLQ